MRERKVFELIKVSSEGNYAWTSLMLSLVGKENK